jgi:hypothetical protein
MLGGRTGCPTPFLSASEGGSKRSMIPLTAFEAAFDRYIKSDNVYYVNL